MANQNQESIYFDRLLNKYPELKDRDLRRSFHEYLENTYIKGVDKPERYEELKRAYLNFKN